MQIRKEKIKHLIDWAVNLILVVFGIVVLWLFSQVFLFTSFRIPTDSMEPTLMGGDAVLVNKCVLGARLFDVAKTLDLEQVKIYRAPGVRRARRGDVLVFNFPYPDSWDSLRMHILKYYVKRCVGLPGDTLSIVDGAFRIGSSDITVGNLAAQHHIGSLREDEFPKGIYRSFPWDSVMNWNIRTFGPLYIPKVGDVITMNRENYILYHKLISWESGDSIVYRDSTIYRNDRVLTSYRFRKNYYFMAGDNGMDSQDSRYWGLLPEEYIVGKASWIWRSIDPRSGKYRWNRFMKEIK